MEVFKNNLGPKTTYKSGNCKNRCLRFFKDLTCMIWTSKTIKSRAIFMSYNGLRNPFVFDFDTYLKFNKTPFHYVNEAQKHNKLNIRVSNLL